MFTKHSLGLQLSFKRQTPSGTVGEDDEGQAKKKQQKKGKKDAGGDAVPAASKSLLQRRKEMDKRKDQFNNKYVNLATMNSKDKGRAENKPEVAKWKQELKEIADVGGTVFGFAKWKQVVQGSRGRRRDSFWVR